jgi:excisionase family DNA binding protein
MAGDREPVWLTVRELAERLRVPVQTVYVWRHKRYGPRGIRVGGHVLFRRTEVERWERDQERAQGTT